MTGNLEKAKKKLEERIFQECSFLIFFVPVHVKARPFNLTFPNTSDIDTPSKNNAKNLISLLI